MSSAKFCSFRLGLNVLICIDSLFVSVMIVAKETMNQSRDIYFTLNKG